MQNNSVMYRQLFDLSLDQPSQSASEIPEVFCWTKMGTEAGQPLEAILRRKELERRSGNGLFAWGIGNSLGASAELAKRLSPDGKVDVLFTPMKSAPKAIDVTPAQLQLWLGYVDADGLVAPLPDHMLVTSRAGNEKRGHYALLCYSADEIRDYSSDTFDAAHARNLASLNPIGASQVTSVVRYENKTNSEPEKPYRVAFRAKLYAEGFVKLARPVIMDGPMMSLYREVCAATSASDWLDGASEVGSIAQSRFRQSHMAEDLFAELL